MTISLNPYTVYWGHLDFSSNSFVFDDFNLSFEAEVDLEGDGNYSDMDNILFYVYPTSEFEDLLSSIVDTGGFIDPVELGTVAELNYDGEVSFYTYGTNSVIVAYYEGMGGEYAPNTVVTMPNGKSYTWSMYSAQNSPSQVIATATSTVSNGRSSTSALVFESGMSRGDLVPGNTYQINCVYHENDRYAMSEAVGTLEMLKCNTTTTITGNTNIYVNQNVTLTITVTENLNDTSISRGFVTVYDGNQIVQSNYAVTGNSTMINFSSSVAGTHDIYAVFTDSGVEYNSSTSNHLSVVVSKVNSGIVVSTGSVTGTVGSTVSIAGRLLVGNTGVNNCNLSLTDYNGSLVETVTTSNGGNFSFNYVIPSILANNRSLTITYEGNNLVNGSTISVPVSVDKHSVSINVSCDDGYVNNLLDVVSSLTDEHGSPVPSGQVTMELLSYVTRDLVMSTDGNIYNGKRMFDVDVSSLSNSEVQLIRDNFLLISDGNGNGFVSGATLVNGLLRLTVPSSYTGTVNHDWSLTVENYTFRFGYIAPLVALNVLGGYGVDTLNVVEANDGNTYYVMTLDNSTGNFDEFTTGYWIDSMYNFIDMIYEQVYTTTGKIHYFLPETPEMITGDEVSVYMLGNNEDFDGVLSVVE